MRQILGQAVGPMADIAQGAAAPTISKVDIARDKLIIREVIGKATALLTTYQSCPNADPSLGHYIKGLNAYLRPR